MYYWMNCDNIYLLWVAVFTPYWNFEYTEDLYTTWSWWEVKSTQYMTPWQCGTDLYTTWSWWEVKSAQYMTPWQCGTGSVLPVVQMSSLGPCHLPT